MLTEEQQKIIENSLWVVNDALKKLNLQHNNDLRQDMILYMCKCLERYDTAKGVKWETYAYRSVYLRIKWLQIVKYKKSFYSQGVTLCDDSALDLLERPTESEVELEEYIDRINRECNEHELLLIRFVSQGFTHQQIADKLGYSCTKVNKEIGELRKKMRGERNNNKTQDKV